MPITSKLKFPHIEDKAKGIPDGWLPLRDVEVEWATANILLKLIGS